MLGGWRRKFGPALLVIYVVAWALLGIEPVSRSDWLLENLLVFLTLPPIVLFHRRLALSTISQGLLFVFYMLHAVGSHWSYVAVPIPWQEWGFERNHYDRLVHLAFGLLMWFPAFESLRRFVRVPTAWAAVFTTSLMMTLSASYEILEWGAMAVVAPDLGAAFVGAQGDEFDGTKDMAFAWAGCAVSMAFTLGFGRRIPEARPVPRPPTQPLRAQASAPTRTATGPQKR